MSARPRMTADAPAATGALGMAPALLRWYDEGLDKSPERRTALKSQIWKATYHNYRSLSNCVDRLKNNE